MNKINKFPSYDLIFSKEFENDPEIRIELEKFLDSDSETISKYLRKNNIEINQITFLRLLKNGFSDSKFDIKSYLEIHNFLISINQNAKTIGGSYELEYSNTKIFSNLLVRDVKIPPIITLQFVYAISLHLRTIVGGAEEVIKYLGFLQLFNKDDPFSLVFMSVLCSEFLLKLSSSYCNDTFCADVYEGKSSVDKCSGGAEWDEKKRHIVTLQLPKEIFIPLYFIGGEKIELFALIFRLYNLYGVCVKKISTMPYKDFCEFGENNDCIDIILDFFDIDRRIFFHSFKPFLESESEIFSYEYDIDLDETKKNLDKIEDKLILKIWVDELKKYINTAFKN